MKACYTCGFYKDGWCTLRNQGHSPGGGCSSWSGRGAVKGTKSTRKHTARTKRATLACGNCIWRKKGKCTNKNSQAYGEHMTSGALCTAFENEEGYILQNDKERCERLLKGKQTASQKPSITANKAKKSSYSDYRKHPSCATCIWRKKGKCCNRESENFKAVISHDGFCLFYEHKSGYRIREIPAYTTKPESKASIPPKDSIKTRDNASARNNSAPKRAGNNMQIADNTARRNQSNSDHCNRCKFLSNNGTCQNKQSSSYGKKVHKLSWCIYYKFWQD